MNNEHVTIQALRWGDNGISDVKLTDGRQITLNEALSMAKDGKLEGYSAVNYSRDDKGSTKGFLRGTPNGDREDNIRNLPTF